MGCAYEVNKQSVVRLSDIDPDDTCGINQHQAEKRIRELGAEMGELQELLFAAGQTGLLIVLQGRDTSGKDGSIRSILNYVNVQSCRVAAFKEPAPEELKHDFLWRIHQQTPARGSVVIFNRSHYEDVLVVRVHNLVTEQVWGKRYDHINNFEEMLSEEGAIILKFFLHITKGEQKKRLLDREKDTTKAWKLAVSDWTERELWDRYTEAYEDVLNKCSTSAAPWYIVPANHKWFRNLAITETIVNTLRPFKSRWMTHLEQIGRTAKKELDAYRSSTK